MTDQDKNLEPLHFELVLAERPVTIGNEQFVLMELDGLGRDTYLNDVGHRVRLDKEGKAAGVKNFKGMQAALLTMALRKEVGGKRQVVSINEIQTWPAKVISSLFDAAKELSNLGKEKGEPLEKKDIPEGFINALKELGVDDETIEDAVEAAKEEEEDEEGND